MLRLPNHVLWLSATLLLVLVVGCGRGGTPTYRAGGTVKYEDGSPLFAGTVSFRSLDSARALRPAATSSRMEASN